MTREPTGLLMFLKSGEVTEQRFVSGFIKNAMFPVGDIAPK